MLTVWKLTVSFGNRHCIEHFYATEADARASYQRYADRQPMSQKPAFMVQKVYVHENVTEI